MSDCLTVVVTQAPTAILIAEDQDHGLLLKVLLEREGLRVLECAALDELPEIELDRRVAVCLVEFPGVTELAVAMVEEVRQDHRLSGCPIVAIVATHDGALRQALCDAGIDALLAKPLVPWALEAQIKAAMRLSESRTQAETCASLLAENREFLGYLVHDLNNPLSVIGVGMSLVASEPLTPGQAQALALARDAQERLERLVRSLLDVERVDAGGRLRFDRVPVGLAALCEEARSILEPLGGPGRITMRAMAPPDLEFSLDRELVLRALVNLGDNAIRHAPSGSTVMIAAELRGGLLRLSVIDEGPGVAPELRERIFERHVQGVERRSQGAAGLGLAFCRVVADGHGGRIWVEAGGGGGARFNLELSDSLRPSKGGRTPGHAEITVDAEHRVGGERAEEATGGRLVSVDDHDGTRNADDGLTTR